ncbi:MAG: cobyric acid synthase [Planctomycetes bacterium]|nr:cobyric acid synthase [Planctomycetota bacterium]
MAKAIMIQGTASSAGKSFTATGLCRIFRQDGFAVAPFKSQNMALNSFITRDGLEMGRAQVVQAEAAGVEPSVLMNPILLKPTGDATSQVIVDGEVAGTMAAAEYYRRKRDLMPVVRRAYDALAAAHDIIVIEGAGSPAEINLREDDLVNMGLAAMADAPVLLVGDIDRGGVFASLYGTVALVAAEERQRIRGLVINKFRGDVDLLRPGLTQLEALTGVPVIGVVPWLGVDIDDEDSLSPRLSADGGTGKPLTAAVVRLPRLANFTDFNPLDRSPFFRLRYVASVEQLGAPDLVILPGSKNTMADLAWLRQNGLEAAVKGLARAGVPVVGICGGFQMLGRTLADPDGVEAGGTMRGMELLPIHTRFTARKTRTRVTASVAAVDGFFSGLAGARVYGYEIHMGCSQLEGSAQAFCRLDGAAGTVDGAVVGNVLGTYLHGLFDSGTVVTRLAERLLAAKGLDHPVAATGDQRQHRERQYDLLAAALRESLDLDAIYRLLQLPAPGSRQ